MRLLALSLLLLAGCPQDRIDIVGADADGDGFHTGIDCDDDDDAVSPGASEVAYNGVDDDCDATTADDDLDGDGFAVAEDCADDDARRFPGATEVCNGKDDDCDVDTDEGLATATWYADDDRDGYGDAETTSPRCEGDSGAWVRNDLDCDDAHDAVHPGADEECNDADDDCDGAIDTDAVFVPTWYRDADGDLFGDAGDTTVACDPPAGYVANPDDCDDTASTGASVNPGEDETCNGIDDDCDTAVDVAALDALTFYFDHDGDTFGTPDRTLLACTTPDAAHWVGNDDDCWDFLAGAHPGGTELCNGIDDDCDGTPDDTPADRTTWYQDADGDGFGEGSLASLRCDDGGGAFVANALDCDDDASTGATVHPGGTETCDGVDNDCNGIEDDVPSAPIWFEDFDQDDYGDALSAIASCTNPTDTDTFYVADASDCDDDDPDINPDGIELCDGVDEDCNGLVDDGAAPLQSWYLDADDDGQGDLGEVVQGCSAPTPEFVANSTDCDDADAAIHVGASQTCSLVDTNCDLLVPSATACTWGTTCLDVLEEFPAWGGVDRTFLLDPESNGSPTTYVCDMTSAGDRPGAGWTQILSQTFQNDLPGSWQWDPSGGTGASTPVVTSCGTFGKILAVPSGSTTAGGIFFQSFAGLPHDEVWVTFDFIQIDTWDGEFGYLSVLDAPGSYDYLLYAQANAAATPSSGNQCGGATADGTYDVIEHGATDREPLEVRVGSTLDEVPANESFGFDNIEIWDPLTSPVRAAPSG